MRNDDKLAQVAADSAALHEAIGKLSASASAAANEAAERVDAFMEMVAKVKADLDDVATSIKYMDLDLEFDEDSDEDFPLLPIPAFASPMDEEPYEKYLHYFDPDR